MEIITGVDRRRRWRLEDKLRIVSEVERSGACFADVARRHEVSRGLLWLWRDRVRRGVMAADASAMFVPVQVTASLPATVAAAPAATEAPPTPGSSNGSAATSLIEIALPEGTVIRVGEDIGTVALRRILAALRG
ncbi:IS66-like element accessory protein TnpA [Humitalea sp. 24SJ18S-53]|uniref:IS66-like element accessory protein TnpA n=1 Tax=Humitalea sp. 24SJ18S-53 TaxID=3422307 RepID=UPI003D6697F4